MCKFLFHLFLFFAIYLSKNMGCFIIESPQVWIFLTEEGECDSTWPSVFLQISLWVQRLDWTQVPSLSKTISRISVERSRGLVCLCPFSPYSAPQAVTSSWLGRSPPEPSCYLKWAISAFQWVPVGYLGVLWFSDLSDVPMFSSTQTPITQKPCGCWCCLLHSHI